MSKRTKWLLSIGVIAALVVGWQIAAFATGPVGTASGFEDDDGNLADNSGSTTDGIIDWNSFAPVTWSPHPSRTPDRQATKTASGWRFLGIEDWQATTSDSAFAGGVKQDDNCPSVITAKADNKADLKRIYLSSKNVNNQIFLNLAWVRIPQNTTSPSAHVAFEFNQGTSACGPASDGLVNRSTANGGDMLIVYDFEGGSTDTPHITLRRWVGSGACEISSDSPPCWGPATDLTNLGFAEAKVNTFGSVTDALTPPALSSATGTSVNSTLGTNEFGEAGINLTAAGVFPATQCVSFGTAYGVSRTSGNSGTAQMKDLVGPGNFRLSNCGTVTIIKHTDPRGLNQDFSYTTTGGLSPSSFTLNDNGNSGGGDSSGNTKTYSNVQAGTYSVTEGADPSGFVFDSLSCTNSSGNSTSVNGKTATITVVGDGSTTCTYVNKQQLGAIKISKTSTKGNSALAGAEFDIRKASDGSLVQHVTTDSAGLACVNNLAFGDYTVRETAAPTGYKIDDTSAHTVSVDNNASCSDSTYVGENISFSDTPLSQIEVKFTSLAGTNVTNSSIVCDKGGNVAPVSENGAADPAFDDTDETYTNLEPGTYTCTVVVDP